MRSAALTLSLLGFAAFVPFLGVASPAKGTSSSRRGIVRNVPLLLDFPGQTLLPTIEDILLLNVTNGSFVTTDNIQGDIMVGMKKQKETFLFFHVNDAATFKSVLKNNLLPEITSTTQVISPAAQQPLAMLNIAFSASGLTTLGVLDPLGDLFFPAGQFADAESLGDPGTTNWVDAFQGTDVHGVMLIASDQTQYVDDMISDITSWMGAAMTQSHRIDAAARPGAEAGHEHFGFMDGISQPGVGGFITDLMPGQALVLPGTILAGHLGDVAVRPLWARDGSFLVFRQLEQMVPEFNKYLQDNAISHPGLSTSEGAGLLGARMIGRWPSGAPVDLFPTGDNPTVGADPTKNNNFDYNHPLPFVLSADQTDCPWTAHVRKTRPRADEVDVNTINVAIRGGIPYGPEVSASEASSNKTATERGLAFVAYQSNIALGFRFQQTQWSNSQTFPPLKLDLTPGFDPIIGQNNGGTRTTGGLNPYNQSKDYVLGDFVVSRGGEYFFSPSIAAIRDVISA